MQLAFWIVLLRKNHLDLLQFGTAQACAEDRGARAPISRLSEAHKNQLVALKVRGNDHIEQSTLATRMNAGGILNLDLTLARILTSTLITGPEGA
jgi:hypothetical protein